MPATRVTTLPATQRDLSLQAAAVKDDRLGDLEHLRSQAEVILAARHSN